ncbi:MAG: hypothetical protein CMM61_12085 [Rhodospirillaceae bacterium]|nr:hypothetical protein [Rhodospirillaceae bacterium]
MDTSDLTAAIAAEYAASLKALLVCNLTRREVLAITGVNAQMLHRLINRPLGDPQRFPKPFTLTRRANAKSYWRGGEVVDWLLRQERFKEVEK